MSDTGTTADVAPADSGPAPSEPAATPAPVAAPTESSPVGAADGADPFAELPEQAVFDRGYVNKIRAEGGKYRTRANELEAQLEPIKGLVDVYTSYDPADQEAWLSMMTGFRDDPVAVAQQFRAVSDAILTEAGIDPGTATPAQQAEADQIAVDNLTDPATSTMTPEQVQALVDQKLASRDAEREQQASVEGVFSELRTAGIDPHSRDGFAILWTANNETDGDLGAAIAKFQADKQAIIDDYLSEVRSGKRATPAPDGSPANGHTEIKTFDDARRATEAMVRNRANGPGM